MKRVFSTSNQVLHLWANQTQSEARCSNVFFEGKSVWSYGRHYELGRLIRVKKSGITVALINNAGYSATTSKHIRQAWDAVAHLPRLKSTDLTIETGLIETQNHLLDKFFDYFSRRSLSKHSKITKKDRPWLFEEVTAFNHFCEVIDRPEMKIEIHQDFIDLINEHIDLCIARKVAGNTPEALAKKERARLKREELKLKSLQDKISSWVNGGPYSSELREVYPQIIRVKNNSVETSRGAAVNLSAAQKLMASIKDGSIKVGDKVGPFTLDGILMRADKPNAQVAKIGCHTIDLDQAKQVLGDVV